MHEEEALFCGADSGGAEAARAGSACGRDDSQVTDQCADLYLWKKQYVGMETGQARQMKHLEEENSWLKQPRNAFELFRSTSCSIVLSELRSATNYV